MECLPLCDYACGQAVEMEWPPCRAFPAGVVGSWTGLGLTLTPPNSGFQRTCSACRMDMEARRWGYLLLELLTSRVIPHWSSPYSRLHGDAKATHSQGDEMTECGPVILHVVHVLALLCG